MLYRAVDCTCSSRFAALPQTEQWLRAVLGTGHDAGVNCVLEALRRMTGEGFLTTSATAATAITSTTSSGGGSGLKRRYPDEVPSFFGSATAAARKKKQRLAQSVAAASGTKVLAGTGRAVVGGSATSAQGTVAPVSLNGDTDSGARSTYGQCLLRLDLDSLVPADGVAESDATEGLCSNEASILKAAVKSRSAYEAAARERERLLQLEAWRIQTETSSRHVTGVVEYYYIPRVFRHSLAPSFDCRRRCPGWSESSCG